MDTGVDVLKTASEKLVHETDQFIGNKMADAVAKSNDEKIVKHEPIEEIITSLEKRHDILNDLRQVLL